MEGVKKAQGCLYLREHGQKGMWEAHFCVFNVTAHGETPELAITRALILWAMGKGETNVS